jgi:pentatricopeptide repeat protein
VVRAAFVFRSRTLTPAVWLAFAGLFERKKAHKVTTPLLPEPPPDQAHRQVVVKGFERNRAALERTMEGFGHVESTSMCKKPELDLGRDHIDVNAFIGRGPRHPRGTRRVDIEKASNRSSADGPRDAPVSLAALQGAVRSRRTFSPGNMATGPIREQAFASCHSLVAKYLSAHNKEHLIPQCPYFTLEPGEELIVEGDQVRWLFIVVSGVYQIFATVLQKELLMGSMNGAGQLLGERDFLRREYAQALVGHEGKDLRHSVTVLADDDCSVVAVPVDALDECLRETSFGKDVQELFEARAAIVEVVARGPPGGEKGLITALLDETEVAFLVDACGIVEYDEGDVLHNRPEITECLTAIIIEGEVEVRLQETNKQLNRIEAQKPAPESAADPSAHDTKRTLLPGDELDQVVRACQAVWQDPLVYQYNAVAIENTKILYIRYEEILPILTTNFALRNHVKAVLRDVALKSEYHFYFCPWTTNLEWRIFNLGTARRVRQALWNNIEHAENQVFWNRTAEHLPQEDWESMLSDFVVTITFGSSMEAMSAVQQLEKKWQGRFASAKIAGSSGDYSSLVKNTAKQIRACGPSEQKLQEILDGLHAQGMVFDAQLWRELLRSFNACRPLPVEKSLDLLEALAYNEDLDAEMLMDTIENWCISGHTRSAAKFLDLYAGKHGDEVVPPKSCQNIVTGWVREREALMALASMWSLGAFPDIDLVHSVIALLVYVRCISEAKQVLAEMEACAIDEGLGPTKQTYLLVISGLTMISDGDEIATLIRRMERRLQVPPEPLSLNFMIEAFCISGDVEKAKEIVDTMHSLWNCHPDEDSYSILGAGYIKAGTPEKAAQLLVSVGARGYDAKKVDLQDIVNSWKQGKWRQAKTFEIELPAPTIGDVQGTQESSRTGLTSLHHRHERISTSTTDTSLGTYNITAQDALISVGAIQEAVASQLSESHRRFQENEQNASRYHLLPYFEHGSVFLFAVPL